LTPCAWPLATNPRRWAVGLIDLAKARLEADGWQVSLAGPGLRAATGILLVGHKPGPRERVLVCPECGGEVEPALYEVARGEGLAPTWGWACPACGWLGLEDDPVSYTHLRAHETSPEKGACR